MKITVTLPNPPSKAKVLQALKCAAGVHHPVTLKGRESDGIRSRQTLRGYCDHCGTSGVTVTGEWFTPEVSRGPLKVRVGSRAADR